MNTEASHRRYCGRTGALLWIALFLSCCVLRTPADPGPAPPREIDVKAAFIFNFTQFVEWPATAFPSTNAPLVIGVMNADGLSKALESIVRGEQVRGHPLLLRRIHGIEEARATHLLFIGSAEEARLDRILSALGKNPVLTVSDLNGFADHGGMIELFTAGNKVRFKINPDEARQAGLQINARLLRLAEIAHGAKR